jgi:RNA polymerase sigma-70 factor (ECF subfamily)
MNSKSDEAVVVRLHHGDQAALEEIYQRYSRSIYSLSFRILREAALAEDVVQEVFLRLWRQPTAYDAARGTLSSWLMSVAHHRSIDMLRRRKTRAEQSLPEDWASDHIVENGALDPADMAGQQDQAAAIRRALTRIPLEQRKAIEMAFFQGKTHAEISAELNEPLGTAKTRIRLGMRKLRTLLEAEGISVRVSE